MAQYHKGTMGTEEYVADIKATLKPYTLAELAAIVKTFPDVVTFIKEINIWDSDLHLYTDNVKEFEYLANRA